ncbi:MAG: hypothetical protein Kow0068_00130 [Marinilabiliales bacterium]
MFNNTKLTLLELIKKNNDTYYINDDFNKVKTQFHSLITIDKNNCSVYLY